MLPEYVESFISMMQGTENQNLSCFITNKNGYNKLTLVWKTCIPVQNQYFKEQQMHHALTGRRIRNYNRAAQWRSNITVAKQRDTDSLDDKTSEMVTPGISNGFNDDHQKVSAKDSLTSPDSGIHININTPQCNLGSVANDAEQCTEANNHDSNNTESKICKLEKQEKMKNQCAVKNNNEVKNSRKSLTVYRKVESGKEKPCSSKGQSRVNEAKVQLCHSRPSDSHVNSLSSEHMSVSASYSDQKNSKCIDDDSDTDHTEYSEQQLIEDHTHTVSQMAKKFDFEKITFDYRDENHKKLRATYKGVLVYYDITKLNIHVCDKNSHFYQRHIETHARFKHISDFDTVEDDDVGICGDLWVQDMKKALVDSVLNKDIELIL